MRVFLFLLAFLISGCGGGAIEARLDAASDIAARSGMTKRLLNAGIFNLTSWEKIKRPGADVTVYIEGDGLAWVSRYKKSMNPTPPNPLGLRLAAADTSENVVYLARPCQYSGLLEKDSPCPDIYWTGARSAPEVIEAYKQALDDIVKRAQAKGVHLVGYSGGAAIAALAAARGDILSLRTVAGNLDYAAFTALHGISPMSGSIDPATVAEKIASIPQMHFIGNDDKTVPAEIFESWKRASGSGACIRSTTVAAAHEKGWAEQWGALQKTAATCY